jgi:CheY-like chemotaxis protein
MDVELPEMDGYEATHQIRQFNKDLIIIAQTAFGLTGDKERALEAGCDDYISKPIHSKILFELIKKYFNKLPRSEEFKKDC